MSQAGPSTFCMALTLPKLGHSAEEFEDAAAADEPRGRFAIADGAAESSFAALWARLLVTEFVRAPALNTWADWLPPVQARWAREVGAHPLPWYTEIKVQQGAFATFLGVVIQGDRWQAVAVGDSCLFHVRDNRLRLAFPLTTAGEFDNAPWLVGSRTTGSALEGCAHRAEEDWQPGDRLWLMTDALAHWFLQEVDRQQGPWEELERLLRAPAPQHAFAQWVACQRDTRRLRNDDVTVMLVQR
jgi:hypothetical protein